MNIIKLGRTFFRMRSFTPIVLLIICIIKAELDPYHFILGLSMIGAGEVARMWSVGYIGEWSRETKDARADRLIVDGPYRYVRNPLYLGNILIYSGFTVLSNVFFPALPVITIIVFTCIYYAIARFEESSLRSKFGSDFDDYFDRTARFIPHLEGEIRAYTGYYRLSIALRSEVPTLISLGLSLGGIALKFLLVGV